MYGKYFVLFAILLTGYLMRKFHIVNDEMNGGLNKLIIYFAYPCLLVENIGTMKMDGAMIFDFLLMAVLTGALMMLYEAVAYGATRLMKVPDRVSNVTELAMTLPNDGFLGFPVALIFFGQEGLFLMIAHNVALNVITFSYGLHCLRRNDPNRPHPTAASVFRAAMRVILNPNLLAIYLGLAISLLHLPLANPVEDYLTYMGAVATPMAMFFIGSSLVGSRFSAMFKNGIVWGSAIIKLAILPVLTFLAVFFLPIRPILKVVLVLGCCFPTAATVSMLAEQEHQNKEVASRILFFSTVISMASIPLSAHLLSAVFL